MITRVKLYNASNFFDPRAVPASDYGDIAAAISDERGHDEPDGREDVVEQVIVESHPSLIGERVERFLDALDGRGSKSPWASRPCIRRHSTRSTNE